MNMTTATPNRTITEKGSYLSDEAYDAIHRMIVTRELQPNQLVSESELARALSFGRTPIRDALQRLKFEGFVEIKSRRGIIVTTVDVTGQLDLLEIRRLLERLTIRLASERATETQRTTMRMLADELERAVRNGDKSQYLDINTSIHRIEALASHNPILENQMRMIHSLSRRFWYAFISDTDSFSKAAKHHAATLRAAADGEAQLAIQHNLQLLDLLESVTREAIDQRYDRSSHL